VGVVEVCEKVLCSKCNKIYIITYSPNAAGIISPCPECGNADKFLTGLPSNEWLSTIKGIFG
jgi:hypothetical protein